MDERLVLVSKSGTADNYGQVNNASSDSMSLFLSLSSLPNFRYTEQLSSLPALAVSDPSCALSLLSCC